MNLGCRLLLFVLIATLVSRLKETRDREQHLAELEHEAAERLQELNDIKDALMRSVIVGAREPLGDIYARIVTLGFDLPTLSVTETRAVLAEIADASRRLSTLVNNLIPEETAWAWSANRSPAFPPRHVASRPRLLELAAYQHLRPARDGTRRCRMHRRRAHALVGARGGGGRIGPAGRGPPRRRWPATGSPHVRQATCAPPLLCTAATPTSAQSSARRWNLM